MFRKIILAFIVLLSGILFTGCTASSHTVRVVKPKKHWFPYDQTKHRKQKRTKIVRMKS